MAMTWSCSCLVSFLLAAVPGFADPPAENKPPVIHEPALRAELAERVQQDQDARKAWIAHMRETPARAGPAKDTEPALKRMIEIDHTNTQRMHEIVDKYGWPGRSLVGADGAHNAWLLLQHADRDPAFQRRCLDLMEKAGGEEVSRTDVAYLTDRVLLKEGKKQVYGTQVTGKDGLWQAHDLEDPEHVDERRRAVGLGPLSEYLEMVSRMYGPAKEKK